MGMVSQKTYVAILLASAVILFAGACGNGDETAENNSDPVDAGDVVEDAEADAGDTADDSGEVDTGPETIDIAGQLLSTNENPAEGVRVFLISGRVTTTDSDGNFAFSDVETPYDIGFSRDESTDLSGPAVLIFQGLTRSDPVLASPGLADVQRSDATLSGQVTGGLFDESDPPDFKTAATFQSPRAYVSVDVPELDAGLEFSGSDELSWNGTDSVTGRIQVLQWEVDTDFRPTTFAGYGAGPELTVNPYDSLTDLEVALDDSVSDASLDGQIDVPDNYNLGYSSIYAEFDNQARIRLFESYDAQTDFPYVTPDAEGIQIGLYAVANSGDRSTGVYRRGFDPGADDATLELSTAPALQSPANNATGLSAGTEFSWTNFDPGIHLVQLSIKSTETQETGPLIRIYTDETTATLPDLEPFGFDLPSDQPYEWQVLGLGPLSDIDEAATKRLGELSQRYPDDPTSHKSDENIFNFDFARSAGRNITTAE